MCHLKLLSAALALSAAETADAATGEEAVRILVVAETQITGEQNKASMSSFEGYLHQAFDTADHAADIKIVTKWPQNDAAFDGLRTVVWYADASDGAGRGVDNEQRVLAALKARRIGLVQLGRTLPATATTQPAMRSAQPRLLAFTPGTHKVANGVTPFVYNGSIYSRAGGSAATGNDVLFTNFTGPKGEIMAAQALAWASGTSGARSFSFPGFRYPDALEVAPLRKTIMNAIAWAGHMTVPIKGIESGPAEGPSGAIMTPRSAVQVIPQEWGRLTWYTSADQGNSATMTTGEAVIEAGNENPVHYHPNCDEILRVVSGKIKHRIADKVIEMKAGDVISIPQGVKHNAVNIGETPAVLAISFSSAYRRVVGE